MIFGVKRIEIIYFSTRWVIISLLSRHAKLRPLAAYGGHLDGVVTAAPLVSASLGASAGANLGALAWLHGEVKLSTIPRHHSDFQIHNVTAAPTISPDVSLRCLPHRFNASNPLFQADNASSWNVHLGWGRVIQKTTLPKAETSVWFGESMQGCLSSVVSSCGDSWNRQVPTTDTQLAIG